MATQLTVWNLMKKERWGSVGKKASSGMSVSYYAASVIYRFASICWTMHDITGDQLVPDPGKRLATEFAPIERRSSDSEARSGRGPVSCLLGNPHDALGTWRQGYRWVLIPYYLAFSFLKMSKPQLV